MRRLLLCLVLFFCANARAATFTVTNTSDAATDGICDASGVNDGCTLREAISAANGAAGDDAVTFQSGLTGTIQLAGSLTLNTSMNVIGPVDQSVAVRGGGTGAFSIFIVNLGPTAQFSNLTFSNGNVGFDSNGTLNVSNCTFSGNGGGFLNDGTATLNNCTFSGNGNGIFNLGTATLNNCTFSGNSTGVNNSGGIVNLSNSIVVGNVTDVSGSLSTDSNNLKNMTAAAAGLDPAGLADNGGPTQTFALLLDSPAINAGDTTLTTDQRGTARPQGSADDIGAFEFAVGQTASLTVNILGDENDGDLSFNDISLREAILLANFDANATTITFDTTVFAAPRKTISLNTALNDLSADVTITGPGANLLTVEAATQSAFSLFRVNVGVNAFFSGLTVAKGFVGIYNFGTVTITNCTADGNDYGFDNFTGGIPANPTMTVTGCTARGNTQTGIYSDGTAIITNTTATGNNNGIFIPGGTATIANCTVNSNGYGIYNPGAGATIKNTIATNNVVGDVSGGASGTFVSGGYNFIGDGTTAPGFVNGVNGDQVGTSANPINALLGPLADNGGPTQTMELLTGSPAIDAGNSSLPTDQRGYGRPVDLATANATGGDGSDIGAYEVNETASSGPNFVVNKTDDHDDGTCGIADCTLREAINAANANADDSNITFAPAVTGTLQLTEALPELSSNIDLQGPGAAVITVRGEGTADPYRILVAGQGRTIIISGLTIANGYDANVGAGILNNHALLTVRNCVITGNSAGNGGGGLYNNSALTVENCTFSQNTAAFYGGAFYNDGYTGDARATLTGCTFAKNTTGAGGAITNSGGGDGTTPGSAMLTVSGCTFNQNSVTGSGGAIYSSGSQGAASMSIVNSTFRGNDASQGGGIFNAGGGGLVTATVRNCTFFRNNANFGGSAIWSNGQSTSTVQISHNIFRVDVRGITLADEGNGTLVSQGYNLASDGAGDDSVTPANESYLTATGDRINTDPRLGSFADNGGPTQTFALLSDSPARNAGDPAFNAASTPFDQRGIGFPRVQGGRIDIGAIESPSQAPTGIVLSNSSIAENSGPNAVIGTLSAADPDAGDTFTYSLPINRGSNLLFNIVADTLQAKVNFDFERTNSYEVLVHVSDGGGLSFEKKFTINVTDTNDAPVLNNSGTVQMTVSAPGTSITALLAGATGTYTAPISDQDAGAVQGIAVFAADSTQGVWQFTLDGGATWSRLGAVRGGKARLLAADGTATRLRFLPRIGAPTTLPDALRFVAWDRSNPLSGAVNGALGDASSALRGGKSAYSLASESVSVLAPGQSAPQLTITSPTADTLPTAPIQATGTASSSSGIVKVRWLALYRTKEGANGPGYWNGSLTNPQFLPANMVSSLPAVQSSDGFATWTLPLPQSAAQTPLPLLVPGQYRLRMEALDAYGQTTMQSVTFIINDGTPQVAITSPQAGGSYTSGSGANSLNEVTGTAGDADGIARVTVYLYREATSGNTAGYWNGDVNNPQFSPDYDASINEVAVVSTATTGAPFSTWSLELPDLTVGNYSLRATARDSLGNFSGASAGVTTTVMTGGALSNVFPGASLAPTDNVLKFTITAAQAAPRAGPDAEDDSPSS